jgi:hypothetical protein
MTTPSSDQKTSQAIESGKNCFHEVCGHIDEEILDSSFTSPLEKSALMREFELNILQEALKTFYQRSTLYPSNVLDQMLKEER